jgi:hypothetical protein
MNKLFLLLFLVSCSSVDKFGPYKILKVKSYNLNLEYIQWNIKYWKTTENDQHCFQSNPDNKEIVTVPENHVEYAIDHFYKRVVHVDVNVKRNGIHYPRIEVTTTESTGFDLEIESCSFDSYGGMFGSANKTRYISFRLKQ